MSTAREMYEDGYCCSCHISPPCSFCESMDEEESDALWAGGMPALVALWNERDELAERGEQSGPTGEGRR